MMIKEHIHGSSNLKFKSDTAVRIHYVNTLARVNDGSHQLE